MESKELSPIEGLIKKHTKLIYHEGYPYNKIDYETIDEYYKSIESTFKKQIEELQKQINNNILFDEQVISLQSQLAVLKTDYTAERNLRINHAKSYRELENKYKELQSQLSEKDKEISFLKLQIEEDEQFIEKYKSELTSFKELFYKRSNELEDVRFERSGLEALLTSLKEKHKRDVIDFLNWVWANKYTDNNDADELYEQYYTQTHENK